MAAARAAPVQILVRAPRATARSPPYTSSPCAVRARAAGAPSARLPGCRRWRVARVISQLRAFSRVVHCHRAQGGKRIGAGKREPGVASGRIAHHSISARRAATCLAAAGRRSATIRAATGGRRAYMVMRSTTDPPHRRTQPARRRCALPDYTRTRRRTESSRVRASTHPGATTGRCCAVPYHWWWVVPRCERVIVAASSSPPRTLRRRYAHHTAGSPRRRGMPINREGAAHAAHATAARGVARSRFRWLVHVRAPGTRCAEVVVGARRCLSTPTCLQCVHNGVPRADPR